MAVSSVLLAQFAQYMECYPYFDEPGYDGIHNGGWKCLKKNAPKKAKEAYEKYLKMEEEAKKKHLKI